MNKDKTKASPSPQESVMVTMEPGKIVDARTLKASDHVKALDPVLLVITALTACLGAIIGLEPVSYTHLDVYKRQGTIGDKAIEQHFMDIILSLVIGAGHHNVPAAGDL